MRLELRVPKTTLGQLQADQKLIAACSDIADASQKRSALFKAYDAMKQDVPDEQLDPVYEQIGMAIKDAVETRAASLAGVIARAKALALYDEEVMQPGNATCSGYSSAMTRAVIRDLITLAGGVA